MMKQYIVVFLVLLLTSFASGCMPEENISLGDLINLVQQIIESDEDGQISAVAGELDHAFEDGADGLVSGDFYTLTSVLDIIDNFASYEFQYAQSHPKKRFNEQCKLNYVGKENIDGIMADKIRVEINADSYEDRGQQRDIELEHKHVYDVWLDGDGTVFKIARDGLTLTDETEMGLAVGHINGYMIGPTGFFLLNHQLQLISKPHLEYVGWQLVNRTSINREIGNGQIKAVVLDFQTADDERKYFEIANLNGKNINIGFYTEFEDATRQFQVTRLIPR